ncbi:right-handed parallel beta-helix repeat-containing protein, partial [Mesorhizobium camelthorni]
MFVEAGVLEVGNTHIKNSADMNIWQYDTSTVSIIDSVISGSGLDGIMQDAGTATVTGTEFYDNYRAGYMAFGGYVGNLSNNSFHGNSVGFETYVTATTTAENNYWGAT